MSALGHRYPWPKSLRRGAPLVTIVALVIGAVVLTMTQSAHAQSTATTPVNLVANPSFETASAPWSGSQLHRVRLAGAPSGSWVAQVSAVNSALTLDDWPGDVRSTAKGTAYAASLSLAATSSVSRGANVTLVLREHNSAGTWIGAAQTTQALSTTFSRLTVHLTALRSGDYLDMYAYQGVVRSGSSFYADAASLTSTTAAVSPPASSAPSTLSSAPSTAPSAATSSASVLSSSAVPSSSAPPTSAPPTSTPPTSTSSTPSTGSGAAPSTLGLLAIDPGQAAHLGNTSKYAYVVLNESQGSYIAAIKKANPNTQVLAYMEAAATQLQSCPSASPPMHLPGDYFGVNYCWALKYHPDWFLTDTSGNHLPAADFPASITMDVGNPAYADAWATGTATAAHADGFDGIYLDDVNVDPGHGLNGRIAQYTDQQYGQATADFTSRVGDLLRANGMISIANVGMSPWVGWQLADTLALGTHLTAVNREHYSRYGDICGPFTEMFNTTATNGTPPMDIMLTYEQQLQAQGTAFTGIDYGYTSANAADLATMSYGRAQFLLAWNGKAGSAYFYRACSAVDTASPQWMADLGAPTGPMTTASNGVLVRPYSSGLVILNPSRSQSYTVTVPSGLTTLSGAAAATSILLAPESAQLLTS